MRIVLFTVLLLCACVEAGDSPSETPRPAPIINCDDVGAHSVGVLGDSTAVPWPLDVQRIRPDLSITSRAVSGHSTADIRAAWETHYKASPPEAIIVLGGINDIIRHLDMDVAFSNLSTIYTEAMDAGAAVYAFMTLPSTSTCKPCIQGPNDRLRAVPGINVIDLWAEFDGHPELYLPSDGIHHNAAGLAIIADAVAAAIP